MSFTLTYKEGHSANRVLDKEGHYYDNMHSFTKALKCWHAIWKDYRIHINITIEI